jgi:hypothetical protein
MKDQHNIVSTSGADGMAVGCLTHLAREEAMLATTVEVLREVRRGLLKSDLDVLTRALEQQREAADAAVELTDQRRRLRERWSGELGVSTEQLTFRTLAERSSGVLRARLLASRRRLLQMAGEIEQLNRGNQALIQQSVGLLQLLLGSLNGQGSGTTRYTASGDIEPGGCGPFIQSRC